MASVLTERESQQATLDELALRARSGSGQVALVSGPVAGGKTALLHAFADQAAACGWTWLRATGAEPEKSLPFGVIGQLFGPDAVPPVPLDDADRIGVVHAWCRAALDRAAHGPLLITIDDVQHIDSPSLEWLLSCIRRLANASLLIVLTETAGPRTGTTDLHSELLRHLHSTRLSVAPLSPAGVAGVLPGRPDAYALTGGNPLLLSALREDGGTAGDNYRRALISCVHRCGPQAQVAARAVAVLGSTEVPAPDRDAIAVLTAAGLLTEGRFAHPAARSAVLAELNVAERTDLFGRAARQQREAGASAAEVAALLIGAGQADEPWAVDVLVEAAGNALRQDRPADAVRHLELARTAAPAGRRTAITAQLARAEWRTRPAAAVRHLPELVRAAADGQLSGRDAAALVRQLLWHGRVDDAAAVLDGVRAEPAVADPALESWLAATYPALARPVSGGGRAVAVKPVDPAHRSVSALVAVLGWSAPDPAVADAELILQATRPSDGHAWGAETALHALLVLLYADRLDSARRWCAELLAADLPPLAEAVLTAVRGEVALRSGRLAEAWADATAALTLVPVSGWGVAAALPLSTAISAATRMNRPEDATRMLAEPVPAALTASRYGLHYLYARGEHYLATGRDYAALADFLSCGKLTADWRMDAPSLVGWRTGAAEAWLRKKDNLAEVRRLLNEQLAKAGPGVSRARGAALRLLAATSQSHTRPQLLLESVSVLEGCGDRYELARALGDLCRAYREVGKLRRASPVARLAAQTAEECGAEHIYDEVLPLRTGIDAAIGEQAPRDRLAALTESEMRVAVLAAAGYTNREIASQLYLTISTIEQHLTRVYRKLQVRYRRELPSELHQHLAATA